MGNYRTVTVELRHAEVSPRTVLESLDPILVNDIGVVWQGNLVAHISDLPDVEEDCFARLCGAYPDITRCARYDHNDTVTASWATLYEYDGSLEVLDKVGQYVAESDDDYRSVERAELADLRARNYSDILRRLTTKGRLELERFGGEDGVSLRSAYGNPTQDPVTTYLQVVHGFHTIACSGGYIFATARTDPWEWERVSLDD